MEESALGKPDDLCSCLCQMMVLYFFPHNFNYYLSYNTASRRVLHNLAICHRTYNAADTSDFSQLEYIVSRG